MADNIYSPCPVKVIAVKKHTSIERSFLLDYQLKSEPGRFMMISSPGAGEVPISISGFTPLGIELTIRNVGRATNMLFHSEPGSVLYVRGPYGASFPAERFLGAHLLVVAGGSGVAPAKPLIEYFHTPDKCTLRQLDILVGFKSPKHILFKDTLKAWGKWTKNCKVLLTVDSHEDEDEAWQGNIGFVMEYIKQVENLNAQTHCVVIGPPRMMSNTIFELLSRGVAGGNIWLSFERHMKCGVGKCGHCRVNDKYVCVDGPVFNYLQARELVD